MRLGRAPTPSQPDRTGSLSLWACRSGFGSTGTSQGTCAPALAAPLASRVRRQGFGCPPSGQGPSSSFETSRCCRRLPPSLPLRAVRSCKRISSLSSSSLGSARWPLLYDLQAPDIASPNGRDADSIEDAAGQANTGARDLWAAPEAAPFD